MIILKIVDFSNYKTAIKIQREIFPNEDGTINILASLDRDLFIKTTRVFYVDDDVKYYLAYNNEEIVGITGLYCIKNVCKESVWLGWFGVLKKYRGLGFGKQILNNTIELAKNQGNKTIRLYTDIEENNNAVQLYKKLGFISEKYNVEILPYDCYIFSKSLTNSKTELWNNKILGLAYQTELDHMNESKIKEILNIYDNLYLIK